MYALFNSYQRAYKGHLEIPLWNDVEKRFVADVDRVVEYYRYGSFAAKNTNLIVRLIQSMNVPIQYPVERYHEVAAARALFVSNAFGITSAINVGRIHQGEFYHGCDEIILAHLGENQFISADQAQGWRDFQAVKVLDHPVSNLKFMLPNGIHHNTEQGLAVIAIDVPLLMVQYREFLYDQQRRNFEQDGAHYGVTHFVYKYVFPNMLYSQTDLVLFNRLYNLWLGKPHGDSVRRHPFYLTDHSDVLDRALRQILRRVESTPMPYTDVLRQLPRLFNDHQLDMPDIAETRQVWWALWLTRQKAMRFLWDVPGESGRRQNGTWINRLKVESRELIRENVMGTRTPESVRDEAMENLKEWSQWP